MNNMYSNGYVLTIIADGKVMPELADSSVLLPYNAEYKIRLRNKHSNRALARVWIDGEEVTKTSDADGLIVPAHAFIDFERPLDAPVKFKFVSRDTNEAVEAGKDGPDPRREMGVIRVEFTEEAEPIRTAPRPLHTSRKDWYSGPDWDYRSKGTRGLMSGGGSLSAMNSSDRSRGISLPDEGTMGLCFMSSANEPIGMSLAPIDDSGCTVEGSHSEQTFKSSTFNASTRPATVIQVVLKGANPTAVQATSSSLRKNRADKVRREQIATIEATMTDLQNQLDALKKAN